MNKQEIEAIEDRAKKSVLAKDDISPNAVPGIIEILARQDIPALLQERTELLAEIGILKMGFSPEGSVDVKKLKKEIERLREGEKLYGSCLSIMNQLQKLYELSPDMRVEPVMSGAKLLMKQCFDEMQNKMLALTQDEVCRLDKDNKRLRNALDMIASGTLDKTPPYRNAPADELRKLATKALKENQNEESTKSLP